MRHANDADSGYASEPVYYEFPVLTDGQLYQGEDGERPGPRRILFTEDGRVANIVEHVDHAHVAGGFRIIA